MNILCATKRKLSAALSCILPKRKAHKIYTPSPMATQMASVANSTSRTAQIQKMRYFEIQLDKYRKGGE